MLFVLLLSLIPPILLSDILISIILYFLMNKTFMNIPLTIVTRNIPCSFSSCSLDFVYFGIVILVALLMKYKNIPVSLTLFNICNNDIFRSVPIMFGQSFKLFQTHITNVFLTKFSIFWAKSDLTCFGCFY